MRPLSLFLAGAVFASGAIASEANAQPATLLIVVRSDASTAASIQLPTFDECEKTADHLAMVRSENRSGIGVAGAWKKNFRDPSAFRQEPSLAMICIPSSREIPKVQEELTKKGWYRDIFQ